MVVGQGRSRAPPTKPHYEEARQFWPDAERAGFFAGQGKHAPYSQAERYALRALNGRGRATREDGAPVDGHSPVGGLDDDQTE